MDDTEIIYADPWLKNAEKATSLPDDACLGCSYQLDLVVETFNEAAFFRRTETTDELWIGMGVADGTGLPKHSEGSEFLSIGRVFAIPRKGEEVSACLKLLELLFRARYFFERPDRFVAPGIVDKISFDHIVEVIEKEFEKNRSKALLGETEIIKVAKELGLSPKPTGEGPSYWYARCPETNHVLFINAAENSFGCGWCKRKGGIDELRAFVNERKDRRTR